VTTLLQTIADRVGGARADLARRDGDQAGPGADRQGGYTLVEMVVVIFVLGLVLAGVQTTLIITQRTVGQNSERIDQSSQAKTAIDSMSRNLRTAVLPSQLNATGTTGTAASFIQGTATSVQFYADLNNDANTIGPSRVSYVVAGGVLTETIQAPNAHAVGDYNYQYCTPGVGCPVSTRVLARNVQSTNPVFTYYAKNGSKFVDATLTAAELSAVDSMDLIISVLSSPNQTIRGTTLTTRVTLPNADSVAQPTSSP
jgi:prepilin-type N-terminal cleavage/methylation domain-containing protein